MIFETVRELLAHQLEVSPESITPETDIFEDLGADSLDAVSYTHLPAMYRELA